MAYHIEFKYPDPSDHRAVIAGETLGQAIKAAQALVDKSKVKRASIFEGGHMASGAGRLVAEFTAGDDPEWTMLD